MKFLIKTFTAFSLLGLFTLFAVSCKDKTVTEYTVQKPAVQGQTPAATPATKAEMPKEHPEVVASGDVQMPNDDIHANLDPGMMMPNDDVHSNLQNLPTGSFPPPPTGNLTWETPEGWKTKPASSMRLASFDIPAGDQTVDASIVQLMGPAGGLVANVIRWRGQIGLPSASDSEIMEAAETFDSGLGKAYYVKLFNDANPDDAILATIIPVQGLTLFIKARGSIDALNQVESDFKKFSTSLGETEPQVEEIDL